MGVLCFDIKLTDIIEWVIIIALGISGWYVAIRSTLSQQKKERYNDLVQDFHASIFNFRFYFLRDLIADKKDRYIIQNINSQIKFIYFKANDLDSLAKGSKNKIYGKIKNAGEKFTDSALLDPDIENALITEDRNEKIDAQIKNFFQFADNFFKDCYSVTKYTN